MLNRLKCWDYYKAAVNNVVAKPHVLSIIFIFISILVSCQLFFENYSHYNNYIIFKNSFYHLTGNKDLYQLYPQDRVGLYKYSPTFSVFFGIFTLFPDLAGINIWNLLNSVILLISVYYILKLDNISKGWILILCLPELVTSMENVQSNSLLAGLIILSFSLLEKRNYILATFLIVFSVYIKIYGAIGLVLFIFYPQKWKLLLYTLGWTLIFLLLPLLLIKPDQLKFLYKSWYNLLGNDHAIAYGFSVMGLLYTWFGMTVNKTLILLTGVLLLSIPLLRFKQYGNYNFRLLTLSSLLIWVVIFNHMSESPTFIIAISGVSIWFITREKSILNIILLIFAIILTSLSPTDVFPKVIRDEYVTPYALKALPCVLIWIKIEYDLMVTNRKHR